MGAAAAHHHAPQPGDRFPWLHVKLASGGAIEDLFQRLDDTRFHLLVIGQPASDITGLDFGDLLRLIAIPDDPANAAELAAAGIPSPSFFLLRPDGHVGLAGARLDVAVVQRYLAETIHLRH